MSTQAVVTLKNGQVVHGVSYRMAPTSPPLPSASASPSPFQGGFYHLETAHGWIDIPANDVAGITVTGGVMT